MAAASIWPTTEKLVKPLRTCSIIAAKTMKNPPLSLKPKRWRIVAVAGIAVAAIAGLYVLQLGWPGKLTPTETAIANTNRQPANIAHNPLNAPYKLLDYAWLHLPLHQTAAARMAAVCLALAAIAVFYMLASRWHSRSSAIYATILFAASTWLLHVGRLGDSEIMFVLTPLALLLLASWLNTTEHHNWAVLLCGLVGSLALLTPGGVWFVIALIVLLVGAVASHYRRARAGAILGSVATLVLFVAWLAFSFWQHSALIRPWLGVPGTFAGPLTMLRHWLGSLVYLALRGPDLSGAWLAHTPVLDAATSVLLLFGIVLYRKHLRNVRTQLLLTFFAIGSLLVALNGAVALGFLVGVVYLIVATGLAFFQHQWFKVFPRNPVARGLAAALMVILLVSIVVFHTQRYFIAWQRSPATPQIFTTSSVARSDLIQ